MTDAVAALLQASHLLDPGELPAAVAVAAAELGARAVVLYLVDYGQVTLLPLPGAGVPERQELPIDGTLAGRAFRRVELITSVPEPGTVRLWAPLLDGVERGLLPDTTRARRPAAALHRRDHRGPLAGRGVLRRGAAGRLHQRRRGRR